MAWLVRHHYPLIIGLFLSLVMVGSFVTVYGPSSSTTPKVTWSPSSVTITFSSSVGHSVPVGPVSFTCSPATTSGVVLIPKTSQPGNVALSANPSNFLSCGSTPNSTFLSASCLVKASQCVGTYQGMITVRQPLTYTNLATSGLKVIIVVTQ